MAKLLVPLALFLTVVAFLAVGLYRDPRLVPSPLIGKTTPAFSLESLRNPDHVLTLADLKGKPLLLNVWATWCAACRAEHDFLMHLATQQDVQIYGVNYKDDRPAALGWLSQLGDPYVANVYDPEGLLALDLGVYGAPETFVLDREGMIAYKHVGPLTMEVWEKQLLPVFKKL
jgi:cytochrome c biogenesis protein CcmG/thiol:disulfide interchange protein DsbE